MSARVCSPPMLIDRVTPNVTTPEAMGDSSLPPSRTSQQDPDLVFFGGRRLGGSGTGSDSGSTASSQTAQVTRLRGVSRNLFGSPSPSSAQYARDKLKELIRKESERWNFDFETEKPLPGRYIWEAVGTAVTPAPPVSSASVTSTGPGSLTTPLLPTLPISSTSSLSAPTQPKQRRIETEEPSEPLLIVRPVVPVRTSAVSERGVTSATSTNPITSTQQSKPNPPTPPKLLFPPATPVIPSVQLQPIIHTSTAIPQSMLVKASAVDPLDGDKGGRTYLKNDSSSRRKSKQVTITRYVTMKKRRIGQTAPAAEKKKAF